MLFNVRGLITQENSTDSHIMGYLEHLWANVSSHTFYSNGLLLHKRSISPHRGNFNIIKGAGNNLKMSKGERRHVDVSFSKGLHTVKNYCG